MNRGLTARSPAKLILSGEHAVVYGAPAIALAVNRYAESSILKQVSSSIFFNLLNIDYARSLTFKTLKGIQKRLQEKYHSFLEGRCAISDVLKKPFELLLFTVSNLIEKVNPTLPHGLQIHTQSNIPMGCGMGSSAAAVMSTLYALIHFFKLDIDPLRFLSLGREAENLQHGRSSGLDLYLALKGGSARFQNGQAIERPLPQMPLRIVHTGAPKANTGECVAAVAPHFKKDGLLREFETITEAFEKALLVNDIDTVIRAIRENNKLLIQIGVVPEAVQNFIQAVEAAGGAAKICGAGSVKGDTAGVVLVCAQNEVSENEVSEIVTQFGYEAQIVEGDCRGTHLV